MIGFGVILGLFIFCFLLIFKELGVTFDDPWSDFVKWETDDNSTPFQIKMAGIHNKGK